MNDTERAQWVNNDEGLWELWERSRTNNFRKFLKENRGYIDDVIENVTEGKKRAHYLKYG